MLPMRKVYHLSFSSHDEVLYRSEADLRMGFNCWAEAVLYTETRALADGEMSTHWHNISQTDNPKALSKRSRYSYTRYFNAKYKRLGRLGSQSVFILEIEGFNRILTALNYVNRQGLHHGIAASSFEYPFCSANAFFRKELGRPTQSHLMPHEDRYRYLTHNVTVPDQYRMDESGLLLREDILDVSTVEHYYVTPRNYLYQMNRVTDDKTVAEQRTESSSTPIVTIDLIEQCDPDFDVKQMLINEQGKVNRNRMTDLELCKLIDDYYVPRFNRGGETKTIYTLSSREREVLYETLKQDIQKFRYANRGDARSPIGHAGLYGKYATEAQLARCLVLNYQPERSIFLAT